MSNQLAQQKIGNDATEIILKNINIPPCPEVVLEVLKVIVQPDVDYSKLVKLICGDVSLAASMLKTANSSFFALRNKVSTVQQAVSVLGLINITQIVRGAGLKKAIGGSGEMHMERFWDRSNFKAIVSSQIASRLDGISRDEAYTYGLFHDCGIPILMQKFPDYKEKLAASNRSVDKVIVIENQHYSTNHATVGSLLARNWGLPDYIGHAIRLHHDQTIFSHASEIATPTVCTLVSIQILSEHIVAISLKKPDDAEWFRMGK